MISTKRLSANVYYTGVDRYEGRIVYLVSSRLCYTSGLEKRIPGRNRDKPMSFQTSTLDFSRHPIKYHPSQPTPPAKKQVRSLLP